VALSKCKECGEQISTKADACPKCGAKPTKKTSAFTWFVLILIFLGVYAVNKSPSPTGSSSSSSANTGSGTKSKPAAVKAPDPTWENTRSKDEMTGKRSSYAASPTVASKAPMAFPYQGTKAWLGVGCDKDSEWAYIGFTEAPNLNNTETEDGYNVIRTRFKWNETVETVTLKQKWGAEFIHFQNERSVISRIASTSVAVLELDWHGQRPVHFEFPLRGSSAALSKMRSECSQY
jgi:hypothetical protein